MGAAIAAHLANSGLQVLLLDRPPEKLTDEEAAKGLTLAHASVKSRLARDGVKAALDVRPAAFYRKDYAELISIGNFEDDAQKLKGCDWVIEAVIEQLEIKQELFKNVVIPNLAEHAILSSNTSGLSINALAEGLTEDVQKRLLVTHFFNPPRYMRLLELVPCQATDPGLMADLGAFIDRRLGKGVVVAKDTPNFIANRIGAFALFNAMAHMQEMELTVEEVDIVSGPVTARPRSAVFRTADLVGIDTLMHVGRNSVALLADDPQRDVFAPPGFLVEMVKKGLLGNKSKAGFYQKKTEGGERKISQYDYTRGEYVPVSKPRFDSIGAARKIDEPALRLKTLLEGDDKVAEFAWRNLRDTLLYAVGLIPEIADSIEEVDNAMKWGFNWEIGPFAMLDAIGVHEFAERAEGDGLTVPDILKLVGQMIRIEDGRESYWDLLENRWQESTGVVPLRLDLVKQSQGVVDGDNDSSIVDLGDGVFCLEFHSKMNSIGPEILNMIMKAVARAENEGVGLVVGNQGATFSAGANLLVLAMALLERKFSQIGDVVSAFQRATMALKYAKVPVVAAPFNLTLGGACEVSLHADAINAHAETYMGLVEVGVGILPAAGGCKEMTLRSVALAEENNTDVSPFLFKAFENIGMAKVATSAAEIYDLGYMRRGDTVTMNLSRLLDDAKQKVLSLATGYRPERQKQKVKAPGRSVAASMKSRLWNLEKGSFISPYDVEVASAVADVLCGGDVAAGTLVSEAYLLELEREKFLSLCGNKKTAKRIEHMLKTGKPLRN
jgi:3-hydroxyacyl-CoA dehydrogenase